MRLTIISIIHVIRDYWCVFHVFILFLVFNGAQKDVPWNSLNPKRISSAIWASTRGQKRKIKLERQPVTLYRFHATLSFPLLWYRPSKLRIKDFDVLLVSEVHHCLVRKSEKYIGKIMYVKCFSFNKDVIGKLHKLNNFIFDNLKFIKILIQLNC